MTDSVLTTCIIIKNKAEEATAQLFVTCWPRTPGWMAGDYCNSTFFTLSTTFHAYTIIYITLF
jgi:hypothetical protein